MVAVTKWWKALTLFTFVCVICILHIEERNMISIAEFWSPFFFYFFDYLPLAIWGISPHSVLRTGQLGWSKQWELVIELHCLMGQRTRVNPLTTTYQIFCSESQLFHWHQIKLECCSHPTPKPRIIFRNHFLKKPFLTCLSLAAGMNRLDLVSTALSMKYEDHFNV